MIVAFDTETWLIRPGRLAPRLVCLSTYDGYDPWLLGRGDPKRDPIRYVRALLAAGEVLVGHNVAYDVAVLCNEAPSLLEPFLAAYGTGRIRDTYVRQRLLDLAAGHLDREPASGKRADYSLAGLVKRHFGRDISADKTAPDAWRLRYHELDGVPLSDWPDEARRYAQDDAVWTWRVHQAQGDEVPDEAPQARAALALHLMSCWGLRVDGERLERVREELIERLGDFDTEMRAAGLQRPSGSMDLAALEARITAASDGEPLRGDPTPRMIEAGREAGNIKRDGLTLVSLGARDPVLARVGLASRVRHHLRTTLPALEPGTRGPLSTRYRVLKATGRVSSSKPNLQNVPRSGGFRECVIPRPGWLFIACDYAQLELCTLAQVLLDLLGGSALAEAIRAGRDLHLVLAAQMLGLPYEATNKEEHGYERQFAKAGNYGFPGGMGPDTFLTTIHKAVFRGDLPAHFASTTLDACRDLRERWFEAWPEMREYFEYVGSLDCVKQPRSERVRAGASFCQAANSHFQGLAADGGLLACWRVCGEAYVDRSSPLYGTRPVAFVHDEILLEAREEQAPEAAERLSEIMVESMREKCPDVPIVAEPALMRRWSKGAGTQRDEQGRLTVWTG